MQVSIVFLISLNAGLLLNVLRPVLMSPTNIKPASPDSLMLNFRGWSFVAAETGKPRMSIAMKR